MRAEALRWGEYSKEWASGPQGQKYPSRISNSMLQRGMRDLRGKDLDQMLLI